MSHHFDGLRHEIPLHEASAFFSGIKKFAHVKQAEWTDPPDFTGELEGQFTASVEEVLAKLKQVIAAKFRLMVAYYTYAQSFRGPWWRAAKIEFYDHAEEEKEGAEYYTKRAVALGGPVHMDEIAAPPPSNNPVGILKMLMRAEQEAILAQRELRDMVGDDNPMKIGIEEQMLKDQHHLDETHQFLTQEQQQMVEAGSAPAPAEGAPPEVEEEPAGEEELEEEEPEEELEELPDEEKAASMRLMRLKIAADKTDAELKETGRQRGVANLAAEATREKGRRGERFGKTLGTVAGGLGGALAGKKLIGGPAGTIAGLAAGAFTGRGAGSELGTELDIRKNAMAEKLASMRFERLLLTKKAEGDVGEAQMSSPSAGELQPQNYLAAEMQAQEAQNANEANFYREQLRSTTQQSDAMAQQMQDVHAQLQQLQQQAAETGMQVQQAMSEAVQARDDAVAHSMEAAKARIGAQKLREMMFEVASQDPHALGEQAVTPQPDPMDPMAGAGQMAAEQMGAEELGADAGMEPPPGEEGPAGEAPAPETAPGAAPAAGEPDMTGAVGGPPGLNGEGAEPASELKTGAVNPALAGALIGGVGGAGMSLLRGAGKEGLDQHLSDVESKQNGGFRQASALAAAKKDVASAELSRSHPVASAIKGGLVGAAGGAMAGPMLAKKVPEIVKDAPMAGKALLNMVRR